MNTIFKQLEGWATSLKANNFKAAVVRLTALYTAGVFVVLLCFTSLVYGLFISDVGELDERASFPEVAGDQELIHEVTENLFDILLFSDAFLLLIVMFISYLLAKKTLAPLEDAYQKQKRFIADAAHELRTPLTVLKAGEEVVLQQERTAEEYKRFIAESHEEVNRLIGLSNDLLLLAQQGSSKQLHERILLSDLILQKSESMRLYATTKHVELNVHADDDIFILGSSEDLSRLLINLLKNAIDYNKENGAVRVLLTKKASKAILTVEDTGIGIDPKDIPHIFERFYKADSSRTQNASGSGLGLSIAKDIVEDHKGTIHVDSTLGTRTVFTLSFPSV